jgi:hypothetical protein
LITKKHKHLNRPAANKNEVSWSGNKSGPKSALEFIIADRMGKY